MDQPWINCADAWDLTRAEVEGRYQMRWVLENLRQMPGWANARLVDIATQIGLRGSHRIVADPQLLRRKVLEGVSFPDAIMQGTYPVDIHNPAGPGITFEYLSGKARKVHGNGETDHRRWDDEPEDAPQRPTLCDQVPYRSLIPRQQPPPPPQPVTIVDELEHDLGFARRAHHWAGRGRGRRGRGSR